MSVVLRLRGGARWFSGTAAVVQAKTFSAAAADIRAMLTFRTIHSAVRHWCQHAVRPTYSMLQQMVMLVQDRQACLAAAQTLWTLDLSCQALVSALLHVYYCAMSRQLTHQVCVPLYILDDCESAASVHLVSVCHWGR